MVQNRSRVVLGRNLLLQLLKSHSLASFVLSLFIWQVLLKSPQQLRYGKEFAHVFVMALELMESILTQLSDVCTQEYILAPPTDSRSTSRLTYRTEGRMRSKNSERGTRTLASFYNLFFRESLKIIIIIINFHRKRGCRGPSYPFNLPIVVIKKSCKFTIEQRVLYVHPCVVSP